MKLLLFNKGKFLMNNQIKIQLLSLKINFIIVLIIVNLIISKLTIIIFNKINNFNKNLVDLLIQFQEGINLK
jgi:hypothetical protein